VRHGAVTADIRTLIRTMAEANPDLIKTVAHVAFEVDDLEQALRGQEVIIPPNSPSAGSLNPDPSRARRPVPLCATLTHGRARHQL
jgi:hypothetical protein